MATREKDIAALLDHATEELVDVERQYGEALSSKDIPASLRIQAKDLLGNLRAALDYLAKDIHEARCGAVPAGKRLYFPILSDRKVFDKRMAEAFRGLLMKDPDLWAFLESIQPYHRDSVWLGQFNSVNNENKHERLIEQTRTETHQVKVETPGSGSVSWNPAQVKFGSGVSIGGVPIDPATQMPAPNPIQTITKTIWVDFQFEEIPVSALGLMRTAVLGVKEIESGVRRRLA